MFQKIDQGSIDLAKRAKEQAAKAAKGSFVAEEPLVACGGRP